MSNEKICKITEETYEATVNERILLYGMIRQLTFQMKRAETMEDFFHLKEAAAIFGAQAEALFETWDIPGRYVVYGDPGDLDGIKELELLDGEDDPGEDEEGVSFFAVMDGLIARSKAVTADMEAALAELESVFEPFRHNDHE